MSISNRVLARVKVSPHLECIRAARAMLGEDASSMGNFNSLSPRLLDN
jgi:hypothetical protein